MPISNEIDDQRRIVITSVRGSLEVDDIADYLGRMWSDSRYVGYSELFDLRGVTSSGLSVASMRSVAGAAHALIRAEGATKLAMVANDEASAKLVKAYRTFRELRGPSDVEIRVFDEIEAAREWIGLPPASA